MARLNWREGWNIPTRRASFGVALFDPNPKRILTRSVSEGFLETVKVEDSSLTRRVKIGTFLTAIRLTSNGTIISPLQYPDKSNGTSQL